MTKAQLAVAIGRTEDEVDRLWHGYCRDCRVFDQSPLWAEFVNWTLADACAAC